MDDNDVPALEDMSELFNSFKLSEKTKIKHTSNELLNPSLNTEMQKIEQIKKLLGKDVKTKERQTLVSGEEKKNSSKKETFCGFQKGFLLKTNDQSKQKKENIVPHITKHEPLNKNLFLEVQDAMDNQPFSTQNDWITGGLVSKIISNPNLSRHLKEPYLKSVIAEFRTNPQKVMDICSHNAELREFIQQFCALVGEHDNKLGQKQEEVSQDNSVTSSKPLQLLLDEDQKEMQKILSDPEIVAILKSNEIQRLFHVINKNPYQVDRIMKTADADLRYKIRRLIDVGLLQFSTAY